MKPAIGNRRFQETSAHPAEPEFYPLEHPCTGSTKVYLPALRRVRARPDSCHSRATIAKYSPPNATTERTTIHTKRTSCAPAEGRSPSVLSICSSKLLNIAFDSICFRQL